MKSFCTGSMELKLNKELYPHRQPFMKIVQASRTQKNSGGGTNLKPNGVGVRILNQIWWVIYFPL